MRHWDPAGPPASVGGVPLGCRAVPLVDVVERDGELVEVRDRRRRRKTNEVVLIADPAHPLGSVAEEARTFAVGAGRRRWTTVVGRYGDQAFDLALSLVRGGVVHLACQVDERGNLGDPRWWQPTDNAAIAESGARAQTAHTTQQRDAERESLAAELASDYREIADALKAAKSPVAIAVITAAATDLLAGIDHAGPRAFAQAHFDGTKAHDVRAVLTAAGVPGAVLEQLGLRRGDRIGLGGPISVSTLTGRVDFGPMRGPVIIRLDQPGLEVSTDAQTVVVIENLQPAEIVCARYSTLPVIYTAGQFGDDAASLLSRLAASGKRIVGIVDADLGGVRIARRIVEAAPGAEIVDVGSWPHPARAAFPVDGIAARGLRVLTEDPLVGGFASSVLARGYPVEQELATLEIVKSIV
ncbi:MAG: hypothetical protein JWO37_1751 [Acidimicrobiales bacterium]|nr:hypothetical protein [Acidimicrobiales bacterium]